MHIAFVTGIYPSRSRPNLGTFVQQLVWAVARIGERCTVVAPTSLFERRYGPLDPGFGTETPAPGISVDVYRPRFISASAKQVGPFNTNELSHFGFARAARRVLRQLSLVPDALYGHFLYPSGRAVARLGEEMGLPAFSAHGDDCLDDCNLKRGARDFSHLTGIIAVSERNKKFCEEHLGFPPGRIAVFPNGVNRQEFYPRDRTEMRRKHGLPLDNTLVAFAGHFIERKGPHRVLEAIEPLVDVRAVMMGAGPVRLESPQIVFRGPVLNSQVAELLSACDIFVLPTTNEGCSNAILEAFTCGLPVVTSKGDFNDEIVNDDVGLRVDPMNVREIRSAIATLAADPAARMEMSRRALEYAKRFSLEARAKGILEWMAKILRESNRGPQ